MCYRPVFPYRVSPSGPAEDFEFMLQDFAGRLLPVDKTVSDMYEESCMKMLRVYLCSHPKMEIVSASQDACTTAKEIVCELHCCNVNKCMEYEVQGIRRRGRPEDRETGCQRRLSST